MTVSPSSADMPRAVRPVFISYARLDQPQISRAVEFLRGGGLQVFVDSQSISYGSDWRASDLGVFTSRLGTFRVVRDARAPQAGQCARNRARDLRRLIRVAPYVCMKECLHLNMQD